MQRTRDSRDSDYQCALRARRRRAGFATAQLTAALCMLGLGVVSLDAISLGAAAGVDAQHQHSQAIALARGQMQILRSLPYTEVIPTSGFEAAPWVAMPGQRPGDVSIRIEAPDRQSAVFDQLYSVSWRVEDRPGTSGSMRDVELRVSWLAAGGNRRSVEVSGWRVR